MPGALVLAAVGLAIAWFAPVLFSSDVYAYAAYGELARIGLNPYAPIPSGITDPIVRAAQVQWVSAFPICVYGPAFVLAARGIVGFFAAYGLGPALDALRILASLAFLLCGALAYAAFGGDRASRLRAAATIVLNPPAIWCAAEGHNDALALAVVLAGFAVMRRYRNFGAAIIALSGTVKIPGIAAAAAAGLADRRALLGAAGGATLAAALSLPLLAGAASRIAPHGVYAPQASLQAIAASLSPPLAWVLALAVAVALIARGRALLRVENVEGWIWFALAAWVLVPNPYPWYGLWLVAVAALAPRSRVGSVAIALSLTSLLRYVPDAIATPAPAVAAVLGLAAALPLLALTPLRMRRDGTAVIMSDSYDG
ncbi:MAG TPA: hypothetical protein VEW74_01415 [Candidatus Nitrosotalea sp.]|nr:hypothetical protein [Candidatus Nitrosotalea sp.]